MMRKLLSIAAIGVLAVTALVLVQCDQLTGSAPTNIKLAMASDTTVLVSWTAPTDGTPDKYEVDFMQTGTSTWQMVANNVAATASSYEHAPAGMTGKYKVIALFGSTDYEGLTTPTSEPIHTAALTVAELNASGNSGFGWDRTLGSGSTYSMTNASNAASVDLYISDYTTGYAGTPYSVASPDGAPSDPGGVVPTGSWRINSFSDPLTSATDPLPVHTSASYFNYTDLTSDPTMVACYTADGYYALVRLSSFNTGAGTVSVETWFQLVKGLRLIQH
jgi:hypothetical protein